jgi:hypothetical protein
MVRFSATGRASRVLVPLLILLFVLQCTWFIRTQALTNDEPEHIVAGVEAWHAGEFERWHDQPPLARLWFTLPLLNTSVNYQVSAGGVHPVHPAAEGWLDRSRPMNVVLGIVLLLALWATVRRLFSQSAANFVLALAVLSPDLIAHFSLATIDGAGALFLFASVVQLIRWRRNPSRRQTLLLGVLLGGLLIAKFNGPPMFALALIMVLFSNVPAPRWHPRHWRWQPALTMFAVACLIVWSAYFFHVSKVTFAQQMVTIHFSGYTRLLQYEMPTLQTPITIFLPACEWMTGLGEVIFHNMEGHRSFLMGHYSNSGFKLYFPAAIMLKWPLIVLLLAAAGAIAVVRRRFAARNELLLMSLFPAVYFILAIFTRIDIGIRHLQPVYPFVLLYAGAAWESVRSRRWARVLLIALLIAQAADIARYAPNYLSYFTVLVPPQRTWQYLSDSNTDWGQGMFALRQYQLDHPGQTIHLAYVGEVDPAFYGIRYVPLTEADRPPGIVVVSATHLSGQLLHNHYAYRWLLEYPVQTVLDHTFYVFDVPERSVP